MTAAVLATSSATRPALIAIFTKAAGRTLKTHGARVVSLLAVLRSLVLTVTALGGFTFAAWAYGAHWAGIVVGSVSLLVLEYLVKRP